MSHLPDDERLDGRFSGFFDRLLNPKEVEIPPSLPPDMVEMQPHERSIHLSDISQQIRQQNADNERVGLDLGESSGVKPRKTRSKVWEDFVKYKDENGKDLARCKGCGKVFDGSSKLGTTHLRNHFISCQRKRNGGGGGDNLAGNLSDTIAIKEKSVMDQPLNRLDVARMIIKQGDASRIDPTNKDYIIELYKEEKKKLCNYFEKHSCRLCLTCYNCDDEIDDSTCLMVWFIDDDWKLKNKILKHFDGDYFSDDWGNFKINYIKKVIREWGIENNLSFVVMEGYFDGNLCEEVDWFSNQGSVLFNNKLPCGEAFLSFFELRVKYLLYESLKELFNNIRETSFENENFRNAPTDEQLQTIRSKGIADLIDVLKNVLGLKEAGFELANIDPHFKILTKEKWDVLRALYDLHVLRQYCYKYKTANTCFPRLCGAYKCFKELRKCHINSCRDDIIERAGCEHSLVLAVASVLDPRFKMDIVKNWYKEIFGDECEKEFANFKRDFTDIYKGYARETNSSISYKMLDPLGKPCKSSYEPNHVQLVKSDLDRYLKEDKFPPFEDFDILEWWRVHARRFPTLARMARDFLSIQIESFPSSVSDDEIHHLEKLDFAEVSDAEIHRTKELGIKEAYICTESWLDA